MRSANRSSWVPAEPAQPARVSISRFASPVISASRSQPPLSENPFPGASLPSRRYDRRHTGGNRRVSRSPAPGKSGHHLDGVADVDGVEVPGSVVRAQVDAAVTDVGIALLVDRPRGRVNVNTAPGDTDRVLSRDLVSLG